MPQTTIGCRWTEETLVDARWTVNRHLSYMDVHCQQGSREEYKCKCREVMRKVCEEKVRADGR